MPRVLLTVGLAQVLIMLVSLGKAKALSLILGPAGFGITSTIDQTIMTVVQLGALSLPFTALKFMAQSHSQSQHAFERAFSSFLKTLALLALLAVALVASVLAGMPDIIGRELAPYRGVLYVALLGVPAMILNILFVNTLAAAQKTTTSAGANLFVQLSLAVAAVLGVVSFGIPGLYVGMTVAGLGSGLLMLRFLRRRLGLSVGGASASVFSELRQSPEIVSYALLIYVAMSASSLTMLSTRYFVLSTLGDVGAGLMQALLSVALTAGAVLGPMSNLYLTPFLNRQMPRSEKAAVANRFARLLVLLLVPVALPVVLFPQLTLTVLFSSKFLPAASVLFVFVVWQCLYQIVNIYLQLLIGLDDVVFFTLGTCIGYACAALLFVVLIPLLGLSGVALGLVGAMIVSGFVTVVRLRAKFDALVHPQVWLRAALCVGAIAAAGLIFDVNTEPTLMGVTSRVAYAIALALLLGISTSRAERTLAYATIANFRSRAARQRSAAGVEAAVVPLPPSAGDLNLVAGKVPDPPRRDTGP